MLKCYFFMKILSKVVLNCVCAFPHGDKVPDGDGDGKLLIPADGFGDGDGDGWAVMGTGMGVQYPHG
jgi:hypothetical protein